LLIPHITPYTHTISDTFLGNLYFGHGIDDDIAIARAIQYPIGFYVIDWYEFFSRFSIKTRVNIVKIKIFLSEMSQFYANYVLSCRKLIKVTSKAI